STSIDCVGNNNGIASADASGGNGNFSYTWSNGGNGQTISNLPAGTYTVTATDANNCTQTESVVITAPNAITLNLTSTNIDCVGNNNGIASANASVGNGNFSYTWSNGGNGQTISNLPAGTYTVTATDANNCTQMESVTITAPNNLLPNATATNETAAGANDGTATANPSGGTQGYTFLWSTSATTSTISGLAPGTYTVTITDANDCTAMQSVIVGSFNCAVSLGTSVIAPNCFGETGSATASLNNAASPVVFSWSNGATTPTISGVLAGTYTVTATDANNCPATETIIIIEPDELLSNPDITDVSCNGGSDGSVTINATGGTLPYSLTYANGTNTNLAAGNYSATITDANGCTSTVSYQIDEPSAINVNASSTDVTANGVNDGTATATPTGGTSGYTFLWSTGATAASISSLAPDTYTVTVTDANLCTATQSVTVNGFNCTINATASATAILCNGDADGSASVNVDLGTGAAPFTYAWSNGATSATISNLEGGTYTVTVTDANNCPFIGTVTVNEPAPLAISPGNDLNTILECFGDTDGVIDINVQGGTPGYTYLWSNGETTLPLTGLGAGLFTLTITDGNGCTGDVIFNITQPDEISANTFSTDETAANANDGTATATPSGGSGNYTYLWNNNATTASISNLSPGTYTVTVSDSNGCESIETVEVVQFGCALMATAAITNASCADVANGVATLTAMGGNLPISYNWSNGGTTATESDLLPGVYTVTITDGGNCTWIETIEIGVTDVTAPTAIGQDITVSLGTNGTATITPMMIDDGSTDECSMVNLSVDISSFDCSNVGVNPVMLTVTDAANNQSTTTVSVTVIDDTPPTIVCPTDIVVDACTSIVTYGAPIVADNCGAVTFDISGPLTGSTFPFGETTITITATDDSGNETTCDFVINIEHTLTSDIVGTDSPCAGDNLGMASVNAQGSNPNFTYAWSNNATGTEIDNLAPGTYTVTITDDLGCTTTSSVEINEPDPLAITIDNITDETGAGANDGGIEVTIVGGVPPYATSWTLDGNEISQEEDPTQLAGGMYILTITDANGCAVITAEVTVGIMVSNDDLLLEKNIRLYPNPTEENLFLDFDLLGVFDFKIIIQDAIGNVLLENEVENISNDKIEMDVTDFTNGMYFIQVQTEEHVWLRKFIVQKR
ncbi:MAG: T9SS type A sorting domain-containing protein, partial [Bacteroidota bacterium]